MNKYLFLIGDLPPAPSANGICAEKIMRCLYKKEENNVFAILWSDKKLVEHYPYNLYYIKGRSDNSKKNKIARLFGNIKRVFSKLFLLPKFPMSSLRIAKDFYKTANNVIEKENITHVICVSFPGETMYALKKLKKLYGSKIKTILYPLDVTLEGDRTRFSLWNKTTRYYGKKMLNSTIAYSDIVLALENSKDLYLKSIDENKHNKLRFVGIPMIENIDLHTESEQKDYISMVYAGYLMYDMYNPIPVLDALEEKMGTLNKKLYFNFFGVCDNVLKETLSKKYKNIVFVNHGWVTDSVLNQEMSKADMFLNISKTKTNTIPSKVFKYMCLNKCIVHYYYSDDDCCLPYLRTYGNAILVKNDNLSVVANADLLSLITKERKEINVEQLFPTCVPQYTADVIKNC